MVKAATAQRYADTVDVLAADIGQRIRKARLERGMTLAQVGGDDLSRSFLSLVESGHSRISVRALAIVAQKLDLPIGQLLVDARGVDELGMELLLSEAEAALDQRRPADCLRLLADASAPKVQRVRFLWLRGRALADEGHLREASGPLQEALEEYHGDDPHFRLQLRYALGAALYGAGYFAEALVQLRTALEEAAAGPNDPILAGKITVCIGHIHFVHREIDAAISHYQQALDLFGSVRDFYTQGCIYSGLSLVSKERGDLQGALRYSRLSVATFQASHDSLQMAAEINNMAMHYLELGQLDRASEVAEDGIKRAQEAGARDLEAMAHSTLAAVYMRKGNIDLASAEAETATELAPNDTALSRVEGWKTLAEIEEQRGNKQRADELYQQALESLSSSGQHAAYADTALAYSLLLRNRGDTEGALDLALKAARDRAQL